MTVSPERGAPAGKQRGGGQQKGGGKPVVTTVLRTLELSPTMVRVVVGGPDLGRLAMNGFTDAYVKLIFPRPGVQYPRPLDLSAVREHFPREQWPQNRTYTVRAFDAAALELTLDFVVHGDEGLAGPWARAARPGDELLINGPGGGYAPDPAAGYHLFVGDESALPAIAAALERLPPGASGHVVVEADGPACEQPLTAPAGVRVQWVHHGSDPLGRALVAAVAALDLPVDTVQAFVHGEAAVVKELRRLLKTERGIPMARLSISGYWRIGADDESWRAVKADWNREIEASET